MGFLKRLDERAGLMGRMMRTVGATEGMPADITLANSLRAAANRCMGCECPGECASWLDEHADGAEKTPDYCPNGDLIAEWRAQR